MKTSRVVLVAILAASSVSFSVAQKAKPAHDKDEHEGAMVPSITQKEFAATQARENAAEKVIVAKERALLDAEKRKDAKFILDAMADDFTELGGDGGVYYKSDIAKALATIDVKELKMSEIRFRLLTPDAAILMYRLEVDATVDGQPIPRPYRVSTVWTRKDGQWFVRFHQGTPIPATPATADKH